jgi:RimJ/RimL family protein N-acetyltransferase
MNTPEQKIYLGGPESDRKLRDRHARYLSYHRPGETEMLRVAWRGQVVGSIGYWPAERDAQPVYETGWELLPAFHGKGIGTAAAAAVITRLQPLATLRYLMAFPSIDNPGSNGICRRLGFKLLAVELGEYPEGVFSPHNIWQFDLRPTPPAP